MFTKAMPEDQPRGLWFTRHSEEKTVPAQRTPKVNRQRCADGGEMRELMRGVITAQVILDPWCFWWLFQRKKLNRRTVERRKERYGAEKRKQDRQVICTLEGQFREKQPVSQGLSQTGGHTGSALRTQCPLTSMPRLSRTCVGYLKRVTAGLYELLEIHLCKMFAGNTPPSSLRQTSTLSLRTWEMCSWAFLLRGNSCKELITNCSQLVELQLQLSQLSWSLTCERSNGIGGAETITEGNKGNKTYVRRGRQGKKVSGRALQLSSAAKYFPCLACASAST